MSKDQRLILLITLFPTLTAILFACFSFKKVDSKPTEPQKINSNVDESVSDEKLGRCLTTLQKDLEPEDVFLKKIENPLSPTIGRWFYDENFLMQPAKSENSTDLFYRGLVAGKLLLGRGESLQKNDDLAIKYLLGANKLDPENSAPLLFAAVLESKRGNNETAFILLQRAQSETQFYDNYLGKIVREIYKNINTGGDIINLIGLRSKLPVTNSNELRDTLIKFKANFFAEQLISAALDIKRYEGMPELASIDYQIGQSLQQRSMASLPTMEEKQKQDIQRDPIFKSNVLEKLVDRCDQRILDQAIEAFIQYK